MLFWTHLDFILLELLELFFYKKEIQLTPLILVTNIFSNIRKDITTNELMS